MGAGVSAGVAATTATASLEELEATLAKLPAESRAKIATKLNVDLVVVSPLRRTLQTASGVR